MCIRDRPRLCTKRKLPFKLLKSSLGGQRFHNDYDVKQAVNTWFKSQTANFYKKVQNAWCLAIKSVSKMMETV